VYNQEIDLAAVVKFVKNAGPNTKIYIGCDSAVLYRDRIEYVEYTTTVVIHIGGRHGCRVFGQIEQQINYEKNKNRPKLRLMNEVYRAADMYLKLAELVDVEIEVHLDINPNAVHNSSIVLNEAIGYVKGVCNVIPIVKPDAIAATGAADKFKKKLIDH
jgi:predicted RNase H-related nuclease YkuK (DUF458 family)